MCVPADQAVPISIRTMATTGRDALRLIAIEPIVQTDLISTEIIATTGRDDLRLIAIEPIAQVAPTASTTTETTTQIGRVSSSVGLASLKAVRAMTEAIAGQTSTRADLALIKVGLASTRADLALIKVGLASTRAGLALIKVGLASTRAGLVVHPAAAPKGVGEGAEIDK